MQWYEYLIGFAQAVLAGGIGAWLVHKLDYQKFRKTEKYHDEQKRRDALRELLGDTLPEMRRIVYRTVGNPDVPAMHRAEELRKKLEIVSPLFQNNERVRESLTAIGGIGPHAAAGWAPQESVLFPPTLFDERVRVLEDELSALDKSLSV